MLYLVVQLIVYKKHEHLDRCTLEQSTWSLVCDWGMFQTELLDNTT